MSSQDDAAFMKAAVERGALTTDQVAEIVAAQKTLEGIGISKAVQAVAVDKGVLTEAEAEIILTALGRDGMPSMIGAYEIVGKIGEGGMGAVYKAQKNGEIIALKVLPGVLVKDQAFVSRFKREAAASMTLEHVNIVRGLDVGEADGFHFFAMEYVDGETMRDLMRRNGTVRERDAIDISIQMARALLYADEKGFVHRDIKPDNILISKEGGVAKLCDLGLAKSMEAEVTVLTLTGMAIGTAYYVSPEQARGERDLDIRSDIYSLGATLYHTVVGEAPFSGSSAAVVMTKHLTDDLPSPKIKNPVLSDNFCRVLSKMMAKSPDDRYQTPGQLISDLGEVQKGAAPPSAMLDAVMAQPVKQAAQPEPEAPAEPEAPPAPEQPPSPPAAAQPAEAPAAGLSADQKFKLILSAIVVGGVVFALILITVLVIVLTK